MVLRKLTMTTAMTTSTMALLYASTLVLAADICNQVVTCRKNGGTECNRKNQACPPCIYTLADTYTCWEKDNVTNTCPFTGVKYDCSTAWATTTTNTTTAPTATATANKSKLVMYAAIGGGALLLILLLVVIFCVRRRRRARNMPQFGMHSPQAFHTKRGGAKSAQSANTPYAYSNGPTTGKGGANYHPHHQRKHSDPVLLESSAVNVGHSNDYDTSTNTTSDSLDAMLTDNTPPTAVLGDPPLPKTRSKRGLSRGFSRLNSGGSSRRGSTTDKISRNDVPSTRYTATHHTNANVLDEYLKMKQEMHFDSDAVSDYVSDTMSDRFSLQSSSTIGGTESEYLGDLMRSRTESECYSEMSYNDEKYSFSEDDADSVLGASAVSKKKVDKEVEI